MIYRRNNIVVILTGNYIGDGLYRFTLNKEHVRTKADLRLLLTAFLLDVTNAPDWRFHDSGVFENRNETLPFIPNTYARAAPSKGSSGVSFSPAPRKTLTLFFVARHLAVINEIAIRMRTTMMMMQPIEIKFAPAIGAFMRDRLNTFELFVFPCFSF